MQDWLIVERTTQALGDQEMFDYGQVQRLHEEPSEHSSSDSEDPDDQSMEEMLMYE